MSNTGLGEFDPESFPLVTHGRLYEDFSDGEVLEHHWGRTLTQSDNIAFCSATCHWSPLYLNREFALAEGHRDTVINPLLVLCTAVGLSVEDLSEGGGPFLGVDGAEFLATVHPGDTLSASSVVLERRASASRPGTGIVTWRTEVRNQRGEMVLQYRRTNLVTMRGSS